MPNNPHYPGFSSAIDVPITGSAVIDTGQRQLTGFFPSLMTAVAANEESGLTWAKVEPQAPGTTQKVTVYVTKGGTAHATAGDSVVMISWIAVGK